MGRMKILPFVYLCGRPGAELADTNSKKFQKIFIFLLTNTFSYVILCLQVKERKETPK